MKIKIHFEFQNSIIFFFFAVNIPARQVSHVMLACALPENLVVHP